jgi:predicted acylesterase/phospholipase RssA
MTPLPFQNIAISLSGGGYRATTYHLGALSYLNHQTFKEKKILEEVKIISTISGGTFTGAMYALRLAQGKKFDDCFTDLYNLLLNDQLVDLALHKLSKPKTWANPHKSKDMINAFSEVYNEVFFEGATFDALYTGQKSHLTDVVFGSSEFTYGIQFRFQEEKGQGRFGNKYLNLPHEASRKIRIADAVAASSCFPGGFEPMIMPNDFGNGPNSKVDEIWNEKYKTGKGNGETALMDGGVIDNLGIEGVKLAEKRHSTNNEPFIGTYIVSDVSSDMMAPYKVPILKEGGLLSSITINGINIVSGILLVIISLLLVFLPMPRIATIALSSILPLIAIWYLTYFMAKSKLSDAIEENFGPDQLNEYLKDFKVLIKTPIYILVYLIKFRLTSVLKMVSDVFLRRIRRLSLDALYGSNDWNYRFKSNYIYTLQQNDKDLTPQMVKAVKAANDMPTTLWFTEKEYADGVLNELIACGQFTQCRNLIRYLDRIMAGTYKKKVWDKLTPAYQEELIELNRRMLEDWEQFKKDPYWLLNKHIPKKDTVA